MKRMWSKNELKNIADNQAKEVKKDIATLVDADGHDRFIHGDITINEIEGVTQSYGKWALSGSHLLIVVGIAVADATTITNGTELCAIGLPDWIKEKLAILFSTAVIDRYTLSVWADDYTSQTTSCYLNKTGANVITINLGGLITTALRKGRITFDLLID